MLSILPETCFLCKCLQWVGESGLNGKQNSQVAEIERTPTTSRELLLFLTSEDLVQSEETSAVCFHSYLKVFEWGWMCPVALNGKRGHRCVAVVWGTFARWQMTHNSHLVWVNRCARKITQMGQTHSGTSLVFNDFRIRGFPQSESMPFISRINELFYVLTSL